MSCDLFHCQTYHVPDQVCIMPTDRTSSVARLCSCYEVMYSLLIYRRLTLWAGVICMPVGKANFLACLCCEPCKVLMGCPLKKACKFCKRKACLLIIQLFAYVAGTYKVCLLYHLLSLTLYLAVSRTRSAKNFWLGRERRGLICTPFQELPDRKTSGEPASSLLRQGKLRGNVSVSVCTSEIRVT